MINALSFTEFYILKLQQEFVTDRFFFKVLNTD